MHQFILMSFQNPFRYFKLNIEIQFEMTSKIIKIVIKTMAIENWNDQKLINDQ